VGKRRVGSYPEEFKRQVVERMKRCENVQALSTELDLDRRMMYRWREQFDRNSKGEWQPPQKAWESTLRRDLTRLKRVLADKTLELDFFKGALQKVEARRQQREVTGAKASTTKSGK
jgi:transposase-like protein